MKEARLIHVLAPNLQFIGFSRWTADNPVIELTETAFVVHRGDKRTMGAVAKDADYKSGTVRLGVHNAVIIEVDPEGGMAAQYRQAISNLTVPQGKRLVGASGGRLSS